MCSTCGCGPGAVRINGKSMDAEHGHAEHDHHHNHDHSHHDHAHVHEGDHDHHSHNDHVGAHEQEHSITTAGGWSHDHGVSRTRIVQIEQDILSRNRDHAYHNRALLRSHNILGLNLVSSPGAGKTTLLVRTIEALRARLPVAVIEGDQQTSNDADRIRATGADALQINTGKGCHLDAHMVGHALESLALPTKGVLFIENVGNLVCPADFDLGEEHKVVILSTTEGEDKPLKYPNIFLNADIMILNKIDLLPHLQFDAEKCVENAKLINPGLKIFRTSATTGEGISEFIDWIVARRAAL